MYNSYKITMIIQKGKDRLWELVYKINGKAMGNHHQIGLVLHDNMRSKSVM